MFGIFFRIGQESPGQRFIGLFIAAASGRPRNGIDGGFAIFNFAVGFGRRTENPEAPKSK